VNLHELSPAEMISHAVVRTQEVRAPFFREPLNAIDHNAVRFFDQDDSLSELKSFPPRHGMNGTQHETSAKSGE